MENKKSIFLPDNVTIDYRIDQDNKNKKDYRKCKIINKCKPIQYFGNICQYWFIFRYLLYI